MAIAGELIRALKAAGISYSEIARQVGRDSSFISQVARGKKVGANLEKALEQIAKNEPVEKPEPRVTKSGEVAKVRQPAAKSEGEAKPKLLKDKEGRIRFAPASERQYVFTNRLSKIAEAGGKVSFRVTLTDGTEETIFRKGGIFAQRAIFLALNHPDGAFEWLAENLRYGVGGEIQSVEITAIY